MFFRLLAFVEELKGEEDRGIAERLHEEELVMFNLLTRPDIKLAGGERDQVKAVAKGFWTYLSGRSSSSTGAKRQHSRAQVFVTIRDVLD